MKQDCFYDHSMAFSYFLDSPFLGDTLCIPVVFSPFRTKFLQKSN